LWAQPTDALEPTTTLSGSGELHAEIPRATTAAAANAARGRHLRGTLTPRSDTLAASPFVSHPDSPQSSHIRSPVNRDRNARRDRSPLTGARDYRAQDRPRRSYATDERLETPKDQTDEDDREDARTPNGPIGRWKPLVRPRSGHHPGPFLVACP